MKKRLIITLCFFLFIILFLRANVSDNKTHLESTQHNIEPLIEKKLADETTTLDLLPNSIPEYDSAEVVTIEFEGQRYESAFFQFRFEEFGVYLPSIIETKSFHDGDTIFFESEANQITLEVSKVFNSIPKTNRSIERFEQFTEYIGSYDYNYAYELTFSEDPQIDNTDENNSIDHYFVLKHPSLFVTAKIQLRFGDLERVSPLLLEILKTVRYVRL